MARWAVGVGALPALVVLVALWRSGPEDPPLHTADAPLTGRIESAFSGLPVAGARVRAASTGEQAETDADGAFPLAPGQYCVTDDLEVAAEGSSRRGCPPTTRNRSGFR